MRDGNYICVDKTGDFSRGMRVKDMGEKLDIQDDKLGTLEDEKRVNNRCALK